jgi:hypothetical protein
MSKKITILIDDETAKKIEDLARKTQIPKVRLTKQAYMLLFACYKHLSDKFHEEIVNLNFIDLMRNDGHDDTTKHANNDNDIDKDHT